ncbi:MAG: Ig-like domain-containing protein [Solirubrobacteraceae bacterium]
MSVNGARRRTPLRALAATTAALFALTLAALPQTAGAATKTFTVDSAVHTNVATATADADPGDGECLTANGTCTLRAAIEQANALPASAGDDVEIVFADALGDATITLPSNGLRMQTTGASHIGYSNDFLGNGFFYVVDAERPVTVDFGGDVAVKSADDASNGIFLVKSQEVTIKGFANLRGGDSSIVVDRDARDTVISDGACLDADTIILETCVGLISNTADVTISNLEIDSSYRFGIFVDRLKAGDAPVSNVAVSNVDVKGTQQYGDIWFEIDAAVDGFTVESSKFNSPAGFALGLRERSDITGLHITNSQFLGADAYALFTYAYSKTKDLTVEGSAFDGTRWAFVDHGGSTHDGLTFDGNDFKNTLHHVLDFVDSKITNATITDNTFENARGDGLATVWIGQPGTNNVIANNTFTQAETVPAAPGSPAVPGYNNRWAIYNNAIPPTGADPSGWAFRGNHVDGYRSVSGGPIVNVGRGKVEMTRNTFGQHTNGTIVPTESEVRGSNRFVTNREADTNNTIQTWRPTAVSTDGTSLTIRVAPVSPTLGGNNDPTTPVDIDVFWTADDNAEEYIGRLTPADPAVGIVAGTDYQLPTDKTTGRFRVQTIDANGYHSNYSAPMQVGGPTKPAPPTIVEVDGDDDLVGTGEPGAEVTVTDQDGTSYGPATVATDGSWEIPGGFNTCLTLTATQTNASPDASEESAPFSTPACIGTPVIDEIDADGNAVGTGDAGAEVTLRDGNGIVIGTTTVGDDGTWTVDGPVACGTTISATQEKDGHVSAVSNTITTPDCVDAPAILEINDAGDLTGSGLPNATVRVYDQDGNLVGETTADADGNWKLDGPLPCGKTLVARQTQGGGNVSPNSTPIETGACPPAPVIAAIDGDGNLDGTGQAGATVTVRDQDGRTIDTARVRPNGTWDISGPLPCGSTLTATQADDDGNVSSVSEPLKTPDCPSTPAPAAPAISGVDGAGKVSGTGDAGATVKVYDQDGSLVGEALVKSDGSWTVAGPAKCGTTLSARQIAPDGKVSAMSGELKVADCPVIKPPIDTPKPPVDTPKPPVDDAPRVPTSEDAIRLRCGDIPLALVDVRRGAKSKRTKRYARTTITGVTDEKNAGKRVAIRYLGTNKVVARPKVGSNGRFVARISDRDQRNRTNANRRRFRAEINGERSGDMKLTRRYRITSVRSSGGQWTVRSSTSRPFIAGARVRIMVLDSCDEKGWRQVGTARINSKGKANVRVAAPKAGTYQLVRLATQVRQEGKRGKRGSKINTYTVPRGLR